MMAPDSAHHLARMQDMLIASNADVQEFLHQLTVDAAEHLAGEAQVWCAITLQRDRRATTVASSNEQAEQLDEVQYHAGDGPCMAALRTGELQQVPDTATEQRWPQYISAIREQGIGSVLGVPLPLEESARAGLNVYAREPHVLNDTVIANAQAYAEQAARALLLAVRIAHHADRSQNLEAAMQSRTSIDVAVGIVMAQNRCTQDAAITILRTASANRNRKLRDLASDIIASVSGEDVQTHFDG